MNLSILSLTFLLLIGCAKETPAVEKKTETLLNISYGSDAKQKLDLYLPANRTTSSTKLLILIHGGGWKEGDKADFDLFITELQRRLPDFAIANVNYRLASPGKNLFPSQENDIKTAVELLVNKSSEYQYSKTIALLGASAGAHLALLQAYKYNHTIPVKAVVSLFGPTELISLYNNPASPAVPELLKEIVGGTPSSNESIYKQSSPYNFITSSSPATLLLHGGKDPVVPASQSVMVKEKLSANNVVNQYILYPNEGHGWTGANMLDSFDKIENFLKQQIR